MISIIMAYYERKNQLMRTLASIEEKRVKPSQIVIVDDASPTELTIEDKYSFDIDIIRVDKADRTWVNPGATYNLALTYAQGDKIIVQNPECYHRGNVVEYVEQHLFPGLYFSFGCYSGPEGSDPETLVFNDRAVGCDGDHGWYNHSLFRPNGYHFTSAIMRSDIDKIGFLFNPKMYDGVAYDDDELVWRVRQKLQLHIINHEPVIHQHHYAVGNANYEGDVGALIAKNRQAFYEIQRGGLV